VLEVGRMAKGKKPIEQYEHLIKSARTILRQDKRGLLQCRPPHRRLPRLPGRGTCEVTVVFGMIKDKAIVWPRIESDSAIMVVGSACPMEELAAINKEHLRRRSEVR
jgi:hypothetical protein